jgi:hypothetical protein
MTFVTDTPPPITPVFDYTSRDYVSVYADLLARIPLYLPEWTSQSNSDFGIVLLQMYAYICDINGYYLDRLAGEAFIQTATQPTSILNLAAMIDYTPALSAGSTVSLLVTISATSSGVTFPIGTQFSTVASSTQPSAIVFETTEVLTILGTSAATPVFTGSVAAVQAITQSNEPVGTSDGTVNQVFPLLYNPVSALPTSDPATSVLVDLGLGPQLWGFAPNLIDYGPDSQVYTYFVDANDTFYIVFGDGVNGYVPPLGSPITCTYQVNVGEVGNVGAGTITQPVSALVGVTGVTNLVAATGGAAPESLVSIQENAPASLKTLNRAITTSDFAVLAQQVSGVAWASATEQTYQLVNLYIAPSGGGAPTTALSNSVQTYVSALAMANTTITILPPTYVDVNISANVVILSNYGNTAMQQNLITALTNLLAFSNNGFGGRASIGLIYQCILSQPGVSYAALTALNRVSLTTALSLGTSYTSLAVTALPEPVTAGDIFTITNLLEGTQTGIVCADGAAAGAVIVPVTSFIANANYPIGSGVQDVTTGASDVILADNEIPVVGVLNITVSGGVAGS